ncbi:MAG TPA: helix-turn-helix transcriptional regulator [Prolixibacteraceae bacterium]|nr:helix-turn-helix transcriptional regulator [Prolixibacteraceae bacterium]
MEERIKKFMDYKGLSPSELADSIGVQRSNVTHVLKNRNKPSFQFIEKMLQVYPELNAKWLLLGVGTMLENSSKNKTLFDQLTETSTSGQQVLAEANKEKDTTLESNVELNKIVEPKEAKSNAPVAEKKEPDNNIKDQFFSSEKPIERLIIFFKDQTFKVYYPSL